MENEKNYCVEVEVLFKNGDCEVITLVLPTLADIIETIITYVSQQEVNSYTYKIYDANIICSF